MPKARARGIISWPILPTPTRAERATKQTARFRKLFLVPFAASQRDDVIGDAPIERENQRKRELGDGDRIFSRDNLKRRCRALEAAATSIVLKPAPALTTSLIWPAASIGSVTFVPRTTSTSGDLLAG